jgi:hypothetical protein
MDIIIDDWIQVFRHRLSKSSARSAYEIIRGQNPDYISTTRKVNDTSEIGTLGVLLASALDKCVAFVLANGRVGISSLEGKTVLIGDHACMLKGAKASFLLVETAHDIILCRGANCQDVS